MTKFLKIENFFFLFLLLQFVFWLNAKSIKPDMEVLPDLQTATSIKASSFGDEQFYFRTLSFQLQNAGDTFGRITPLRDYDYDKLGQWFSLLDTLDSKSNFVPSMASYYYSNTQYSPDVRYLVDYLEEHADRDPQNKWWWYSQAVYLAKHKLGDKRRALDVAYKLAAAPNPDMPIWTRQMPAFILEDLGEKEEALFIARGIIENHEDLSDGELNFMYHFIKDRLQETQGEGE